MPKLPYDREDRPVGSLKKPKLCKGQRPHKMELHIPRSHGIHLLRPETTEMVNYYYDSEEWLYRVKEGQRILMVKMGIVIHPYNFPVRYYFKCSVCGKEDYRDKKN